MFSDLVVFNMNIIINKKIIFNIPLPIEFAKKKIDIKKITNTVSQYKHRLIYGEIRERAIS